ncbi:response regulator [Paucibacter sp. R3-3]|uniref:Response regulator n=1 Tax=Roseateles agri TaxID=3098619 RepID=A0ABU5DT64_9BURK|nr:response regulator [Paucibacter sp. R3-3]MDY0748362.1 response regulator [Paucibacter sp. R3-3]
MNKGKILVVDDDRLVLATLAYGLAQAGYDVLDADNGDDAILLAREHRPELALLDIRMEGLSGFDVAAYLRDHLRVPFLFLSAFSDDETIAKVRALGALAYLVKPLDMQQIVPAVEAAFAHRPQPQDLTPVPLAPTVATAPSPVLDQQVVAIAVGVLMHRYSLSRGAALERLKKLSEAENRELAEQALRLVEAVELLAQPANVK